MLRINTQFLLVLLGLLQTVSAYHAQSGEVCVQNEDCAYDGGWESCIEGFCVHKDLFPMNRTEFWGLIFIFFILFITNVGGAGGAGIVVPISVLFFKFDARASIGLSNASIFLSSLIRYLANAKSPHPLK